jgi:hypothetical protein
MPKKVLIKKHELLEVLNTNLELHKQVYTEAAEAFKKNYVEELQKMSIKAMKENRFDMQVKLDEPKNYEDDYTTAIKMVEVDCRHEIELEFEEFAQFYLNKWNWMHSFKACYLSNSGYSGVSGYSDSAKVYFAQ